MKSFPRIVTVLSAVVISLGLLTVSSCATKKSDEVMINFFHWEGGAGLTLLKKMVSRFEKENPGIRVNMMQGVPKNYESQLLTMIAGNQELDIFETQSANLHIYARKGFVLNLMPYIDKHPDLAFANFYPESLHFYRYDENLHPGTGSIYGYPKDFSPTKTIYYNKDIFERSDVDPPTDHLNEIQFAKLAQRLTVREGSVIKQIGLNLGTREMWWVKNLEGKVFSDNGKRCVLGEGENLAKAYRGLRWYYDLLYNYKALLSPTEEEAQGGNENLYGNSRIAMIIHARYHYPNIKRYSEDAWGVLPNWHFEGYDPKNLIWPACGWAVTKKTKHPEEVVRFLAYISGEQGNIMTAKAGYNIPPMKRIAQSDLFAQAPGETGQINRQFLKELAWSEQFAYSPYMTLWEQFEGMKECIDPLNTLDRSPTRPELESAIKDCAEYFNKKIAEGREQ